MSVSDYIFHNIYLLQEIFSHAKSNKRYCDLRDGNAAAARGQLKLLQLKAAHEDFLNYSWWAMTWAAQLGYLEVVKWLHENRSEGCLTVAMDGAAAHGHLHIVKWLHENRSELRSRQQSWQGCTTQAMDLAAENGHLDIVKWLHENRSEGCTTFAMNHAASNGNLEMVQWLGENRTEGCTCYALEWVSENNHLDVVEWLQEHTPPKTESVIIY